MAERELTLTKRPERSLETDHLPDLGLHASAERDFLKATSLVQGDSRGLRETTGTLVQILRFQGQTNIDATPLRDSIQESLSKMDANERPYITHFLAGVEIGLGNIPAANAALEATGENDIINDLRLKFAEGYAKAGIDPQPMLDLVKARAGVVRIERNPDVFDMKTDKQIKDTTALAVTHSHLGLDPTPYLTQARELLDSNQPHEKDYYIAKLAEAYAVGGDFTNAVALADTIIARDPKKTKEKRSKTRLAIAEEQLKFGDIDGALETAEGSEDNILIAEMNARVAIYKAEKDEDPTVEIDRALSLIPTIESDWSQGLLYSMLGKAKALTKEDPKTMFVQAMEKALSLEVSEDPLAELFTRFIADVDASGFDATPVFNIALEWADRALEEKLEPGDISFPEINQGMAIEAIIEQQINLGYLEMAEQTLPKLEKEDWVYIPLLANLAHAKALKAAAA